jgi:hypothetical protein
MTTILYGPQAKEMSEMLKWLLKKEHSILAFEAGDDGQMIFGHTDENTDANVLEMFMTEAVPHVEAWHDLSFICITSQWKLFNRWEFFYREVFCHDLDP